jgi:hypothetical protein
MRPIEQVLPEAERDRIRREWLGDTSRYSPRLHLAVTSLSGLIPIAVGLTWIHHVTAPELGFALAVFVLSNAVEWRAHRDLLHKRFRPLAELYDRHTPIHHMVFVTDDMAMRTRVEFRLVLLPAYGLLVIFFATLPVTAILYWLGHHNLAGLYIVTTMGYVVTYEWLHLAYHLPLEHPAARLWIVRVLRRTHAIHHHPRLMQRWNFNVSLPLWDLVRGTLTYSLDPAERRR